MKHDVAGKRTGALRRHVDVHEVVVAGPVPHIRDGGDVLGSACVGKRSFRSGRFLCLNRDRKKKNQNHGEDVFAEHGIPPVEKRPLKIHLKPDDFRGGLSSQKTFRFVETKNSLGWDKCPPVPDPEEGSNSKKIDRFE